MAITIKYRMLSGLESSGGKNMVWAEGANAAELATASAASGSIGTLAGDPDSLYVYDGTTWNLIDKEGLAAGVTYEGISPQTLLMVNKLLAVPMVRLSSVEAHISSAAPVTWLEFRNAVRAGTIDNYFTVGDQFKVVKGGVNYFWDLVDIGSSTRNVTANGNAPTDPIYFTNFPNAKPVTLLMHDVINGAVFDAPEANYNIITQIDSGATCVISLGYGTTATSDFRFTASKNLVEGGKIRYIDATHFGYYATATATVESMEMAAGAEGDGYVSIAESLSAQNDLSRVKYGSNKYTESAVRQWLNAGAAAGSFWTSKSDYDLAPSWHSTLAGFRNGLDPDLLAVIGETTREVELNTVTDDGGQTTISDKIFLPSRMEIYGSVDTAGHKGLQYQAYVDSADIDKIKYDSTSTARDWWLRSPNAGYVDTARYVRNTTGGLHGGYANAGYGAAAACVIL